MDIENKVIITILTKLRDLYPHPLMSDGYNDLSSIYSEDELDGHLLNLAQKGLIDTKMHYEFLNKHEPKRGQGSWKVDANYTFINSNGFEFLTKNRC